MRNMNFTPNFAIQEMVAQGNRSAGTTDLNGITADCQDYDCITGVVEMGTITASAVTTLKWQGSDDDSTFVDLEDVEVSVAATDDNEYFVLELHHPLNRYNRVVIERATANAALRSAYYILGGPRKAGGNMAAEYPQEANVHFFIGGQGPA